MKLSKVRKTIAANHGYLVHFEHIEGSILRSDYFPDVKGGEEPFETQEEAMAIGIDYAKVTKGKTCNFYLVRSDKFTPIGSWKLENR